MQFQKTLSSNNWISRSVITAIAVLIFYFVPGISHLTGFPLYQYEPMRFVLFMALIFGDRKTAYAVALTVPVFSFMTSSHPSVYKVLLITIELLLNVYTFFQLQKVIKNIFITSFLSILISKLIYYSLKFIFIQVELVPPGLVSTPIITQFIISVILSLMIILSANKRRFI